MSRDSVSEAGAIEFFEKGPEIEALRLSFLVQQRFASSESEVKPPLLAAAALLQLRSFPNHDTLESATRLLRESLASSQSDSQKARLLNDLGCVEMTSASAEHPLPLLKALGHLEMAFEMDRARPEILYNRALVFDRLHLRHEAEAAWQAFIQVESEGPWAAEAVARTDRLTIEYEPTAGDFWGPGPGELTLRQLARDNPYSARLAFEEGWLRPWLDAVDTGDAGRRDELERQASAVGEALGDRGEYLVTDAVSAIRNLWDRKLRENELESLRDFERGMVAYRESRHGEARIILERAERGLAGWNAPLAYLARIYAGICIYFANASDARPIFEASLDELAESEGRYPSLLGRAHWMLATIDLVQRQMESSLRRAQAMHSLLLSSSGPQRAAIADGLMAEALEDRGELEKSWTHRLKILEAYRLSPDHRRRQSVLYETAQALSRRGNARQALVVLGEALGEARQMQESYGVAEAHSALARVKWALGDELGARVEFEDARVALESMPVDQPLTRRTEAVVRFTGGLTRIGSDPAQALDELGESFAALEAGGWEVETQLFHRAMADANSALGRLDAARNWLEASVQEVSRLRSESTEVMSRIEIFHHTQETFDRIMALDLRSGSSDPQAVRTLFVNAERARKRELGGDEVEAEALDPFEIAAALPRGRALVAYTVLPERLLIWLLADGQVRMEEISVARGDLEARAEILRSAALSDSGSDAFRRVSASLYELLIRPIESQIQELERITFVPDLSLDQVPFAALLDYRSDTYLIEKVVVSQLPTVRSILRSGRAATLTRPSSLLAVGISYPVDGLPPLPDARPEAVSVAAGYASSLTMLDDGGLEGLEFKAQILDQIELHDVFHFSGHATVDPRRSEALLHLAERVALSTQDLLGSDLKRLRLVVLSACGTGIGREWGREGSVSLQSAFLAAGAEAVVASSWKVDDALTRTLMTRFHEEFRRTGDAAEAIRAVQLESMNNQDSPFRSPAVWAAFGVVGI